MQGLAIALGVALLGVGLWSGINEEKLQARPQETKLTKDSLEPKVADWPFLSEGALGGGGDQSVWQNIEGATIPAENSLVFTGPDRGKADMSTIRSSGLDFDSYPNKGACALYKLSPDPQWLEQDDVGYYAGERIGVRIIIQLIDPPSTVPTEPLPHGGQPSMLEAWIGYAGSAFCSVSVPSWLDKGVNITYEVYKMNDSARRAISFSGYFPLVPSFESTRISVLDWSQIVASGSHIYSYSTTSTPKTLLQYQLQDSMLTLGCDSNSGGNNNAVFTFSNQSSLRFRLFSVFEDNTPYKVNDALLYKPKISMPITIPDPEPIEVPDVKEIKADTEISYQFNQQIPPEPTDKRDQRVQWTLKTDDNPTVVPDVEASGTLKSWTVSDIDGNDMTSKFEVTSFNESTKEVTIAPKAEQYTDDSFYNHYYKFKSKLKIDYNNPIEKELLKDGKYLDKTGSVILTIDGLAGKEVREEKTFKTSINFAAPVEYRLIDSTTQQQINQTIVPSDYINNKGLVTWLAPLPNEEPSNVIANPDAYYTAAKAPVIPGYQFKSAELNGQSENMQVKYTKLLDATSGKYTQNNVVTLEYQPTYTVDVQVGALVNDAFSKITFDPAEGTADSYVTIAEKNAPQVATKGTQTGTDADFNFGTYQFDLGTKSYQVKQVAAVNKTYDMPDDGITIDFSINSRSQLVVGTDVVTTKEGEIFVYKDPTKPYILRWDQATKKLTIQMINFPQGEVEIEGEEIEGEYRVDDIDFGNVTIPAQDDIVRVPKTKEDGEFPTLVVVDTRLPAYRKDGWRLSVYMSKAFTAVGGTDEIGGILYYKSQSLGSTPIPFDEGTTVSIEEMTPATGSEQETASVWSTPIALGSAVAQDGLPAEGFYLNINKPTQLGIKAGEYQAELTFSVENSAFTTSSGRSK